MCIHSFGKKGRSILSFNLLKRWCSAREANIMFFLKYQNFAVTNHSFPYVFQNKKTSHAAGAPKKVQKASQRLTGLSCSAWKLFLKLLNECGCKLANYKILLFDENRRFVSRRGKSKSCFESYKFVANSAICHLDAPFEQSHNARPMRVWKTMDIIWFIFFCSMYTC